MEQQAHAPLLEQSIEIAAPVPDVWALVSDVRRIPEWSPQVDSTRLRAGAEEVAIGVEFTNRNSEGELVWTTHGKIVRFEPNQQVAFRIKENWVIWSFDLEPTSDGGTRLTQRRETPEGLSQLSIELTDGFMGGQQVFTQTMRDGMRTTLEAIRDAAQGAAAQ